MLQANPHLTVDQVRDILFSTARNDNKTGALHENDSISPAWGYGKVDALKAVNAAYDLLSVEQAADLQPDLIAFPNPTHDQLVLRTGSNKPQQMELFSIGGQCLMRGSVCSETILDLSALPTGVYFVRVHDTCGVRTAKVVKK